MKTECNGLRVLMLVVWIMAGLPVCFCILGVLGLCVWLLGLIIILMAK